MAKGKGVRSALLILMDVLFVVAVLQAARLVVMFFGELAGSQVGEKFVELTGYLVLPLGINTTATPYAGVFDWTTAVTIGIVLVFEAILSLLRKRA